MISLNFNECEEGHIIAFDNEQISDEIAEQLENGDIVCPICGSEFVSEYNRQLKELSPKEVREEAAKATKIIKEVSKDV